MKFEEEYTCESEKDKIENKDKKVISDDAFANCLMLKEIVDKIEHFRMTRK